jgi:hypothetical protein
MGRHKTQEGLYARQLGIRVTVLSALGGSARLRALSEEARKLLIKGCGNDGRKQK